MILITGASGFIGRYLAKELSVQGYKLFLCSSTQNLGNAFPNNKTVRVNLAKGEDFRKLPARGVEAVYHLASFVPPHVSQDNVHYARKCLNVNILATMNVLEYCRLHRISRLVYASTVSVYGDCDSAPREEERAYPLTFYGWSKLAAEILCEKYRRDYGIACFSLRLSSVYGQGVNPYCVLSAFIKRALQGEEIVVWGEGRKRINFIYIKDAVSALLSSLKSEHPGVYNIGSAQAVSVAELAKAVNKVFARGCLSIVFDKEKQEDLTRVWLDITKAKKGLGFRPKYSLLAGLKDYKQQVK